MTCAAARRSWKTRVMRLVALSLVVALTAALGAPALAQEAANPPKADGKSLPPWLEKADWKAAATPFNEALETGGGMMLQMLQGVERQWNAAMRRGAGRGGLNEDQIEQQIKAMVPQYRPQYLLVAHAELQAARNACEIPEGARGEVYRTTMAGFDRGLENFVRNMYKPVAGNQRGGEVRAAVRQALTKILEEKLPPDQFAKFAESLRQRTELRKRVAIECVVAQMDKLMRLTDKQRKEIAKSLSEKWQDDWEAWIMLWQYDDAYLPVNLDSHVLKHLSQPQRLVWESAQKISLGGYELHGEFTGELDSTFWQVQEQKPKNLAIEKLIPLPN